MRQHIVKGNITLVILSIHSYSHTILVISQAVKSEDVHIGCINAPYAHGTWRSAVDPQYWQPSSRPPCMEHRIVHLVECAGEPCGLQVCGDWKAWLWLSCIINSTEKKVTQFQSQGRPYDEWENNHWPPNGIELRCSGLNSWALLWLRRIGMPLSSMTRNLYCIWNCRTEYSNW